MDCGTENTCKSTQLLGSKTLEITTEKEKVINKNKDNRKEKKKKETYKNNKKKRKIKNLPRKNMPQQKRP
jgi:hypothetical protein